MVTTWANGITLNRSNRSFFEAGSLHVATLLKESVLMGLSRMAESAGWNYSVEGAFCHMYFGVDDCAVGRELRAEPRRWFGSTRRLLR